jgi:hypothetical protein
MQGLQVLKVFKAYKVIPDQPELLVPHQPFKGQPALQGRKEVKVMPDRQVRKAYKVFKETKATQEQLVRQVLQVQHHQ